MSGAQRTIIFLGLLMVGDLCLLPPYQWEHSTVQRPAFLPTPRQPKPRAPSKSIAGFVTRLCRSRRYWFVALSLGGEGQRLRQGRYHFIT